MLICMMESQLLPCWENLKRMYFLWGNTCVHCCKLSFWNIIVLQMAIKNWTVKDNLLSHTLQCVLRLDENWFLRYPTYNVLKYVVHMMASSSGNIFRVTGHLCGECQLCGALMFSSVCDWINGWVNSGEYGGFRRYFPHYDVTVMK